MKKENEDIKRKEKENKKKIMDMSSMEVGEDPLKSGEFVSSYFAWLSLPEQKAKTKELENITKTKDLDKKD